MTVEREQEILRIVADFTGRRPEQVDRADIFGAGEVAGDDADELLDAFIQTYGVDFTDFRDYLHYDSNEPAGWFRSWGVGRDGNRLADIPISLANLLRAVESGKWQMEYPDHRLVNRGRVRTWIFLLVVLCVVVLIALRRACC